MGGGGGIFSHSQGVKDQNLANKKFNPLGYIPTLTEIQNFESGHHAVRRCATRRSRHFDIFGRQKKGKKGGKGAGLQGVGQVKKCFSLKHSPKGKGVPHIPYGDKIIKTLVKKVGHTDIHPTDKLRTEVENNHCNSHNLFS